MTKQLLRKFFLPSVDEILRKSVASPKMGIDLSKNGVSFLEFYDWIRVSERALSISPYAEFWRGLALKYPHKKAINELQLFLDIVKIKPHLSEQARSFLLSIPAKLLPAFKILENLQAEVGEQLSIKNSLIRKKTLGDEGFWKESFLTIVKINDSGKSYFPTESGQWVIRPVLEDQKRLSTIYGMATVVSFVDENFGKFSNGGFHLFMLVDGEPFVRRQAATRLDKVLIAG